MDEAASRLRIELDSMPTEIDQIERRIMQLEIERTALKKESDKASKERLAKLEKDLADLQEQSKKLKTSGRMRSGVVDEIRDSEIGNRTVKGRQPNGPSAMGIWRRPARFSTGGCRSWRRN